MCVLGFKAIVCSNWRFVFPSRRRQTSASFFPLTCSGSKAEKEEIISTCSEAATGSLRSRGSTWRQSLLKSSDQTWQTSEPTWDFQHLICFDAHFIFYCFLYIYCLVQDAPTENDVLVAAVHRINQQGAMQSKQTQLSCERKGLFLHKYMFILIKCYQGH